MIMLVACSPLLHGQIPETMSYQGVLTDAGGNPVSDGNATLIFRLYDVASGGTALWQETQEVAVSGGIFNAILGSSTPLNLPFDKPYWLGISIGQGKELTPRVALSASPYSLNSHSTIAEPAQGQGLTIRDAQGNATHVFNASGEALHTGKTIMRMPATVGGDTTLVIYGNGGPALVAVRTDSMSSDQSSVAQLRWGQAHARKRPAELSSVKQYFLVALRGMSIYGSGVAGKSQFGDGVYGESVEEPGVEGYSRFAPGVYGESESKPGVWGYSADDDGVYGESMSSHGVHGYSETGQGVHGSSETGQGVYGESNSEAGVRGVSGNSNGVEGLSTSGYGVGGLSVSGVGVYGSGTPAGFFQGEVKITAVNPDETQNRVLVWSADNTVRYKTLSSSGGTFDGVLQGKALVVKSASGNDVFRVDTNGTSLHKGDETFEGDVILRGTGGKGAKLVDSTGLTLAGFGRLDLDTGQRIGVYGRAQRPGDLAGAFEGDVDVNGEVTANSLHVVNSNNQPVFTVNSDGTSTHSGLESYSQGIVVPLSNGNILRLDPAEGFTIKTAGGDFIAHIRYDGATFFAGGKSAVVKTPSFGERAMYSDESTEVWFTDRGSGELANGEAVIDLDPMFKETVTIDGDHPMIVRVTATDECNGMYVAEKANDHFVVKELMGGRSNATFDWEVSGKRRGYENTRMEPYDSDEGSSN
jgi:hypothetical protein